jgi:hypothetical protein
MPSSPQAPRWARWAAYAALLAIAIAMVWIIDIGGGRGAANSATSQGAAASQP